ncbi:hypothetical protein Tco_1089554 [Tanacetum coccineum]
MSNLPEEIDPGFVSQLAYNIASHLKVSEGVANGVMGNGGSVSVAEVVGNGLMVGENVGNGVNESVQEVLDNDVMVKGVGRSGSQVMNNVNGLVSQVNVVAGGVMENGFVGEVANGVMENGVSGASVRAVNNGVAGGRSSSLGDVANGVMGNDVGRAGAQVMNNGDAGVWSFSLRGVAARSAPRVNRDRLLRNFNQEIREDIARLREYRSIANGLRIVVRRRRQRVDRLEALRNCREAVDTIRFWERMQLEDVEKGTRALLMMRETEAKIGEKARTVIEVIQKSYSVSNKALLTFLVVVSEPGVGIDGVSEETPSVMASDAAVDAGDVAYLLAAAMFLVSSVLLGAGSLSICTGVPICNGSAVYIVC